MHILNTNTLLGELYEADLRLRPAGNSGLLCCHVNGFDHYQNKEAWTWEHQALVRARVVFGGNDLKQQLAQIRQNTLTDKRDQQALGKDVVDMRRKLYAHSVNKTEKDSFKHGRGGITDIEFLSQYWVLAHSHEFADLAIWPDNLRIIDAACKAKLVSQQEAEMLKATYLMQRNALHHSALTERTIDEVEPELEGLREKTYSCWTAILPTYIP
jgi:glutamate-ammonia-ligase adenylyltransferase